MVMSNNSSSLLSLSSNEHKMIKKVRTRTRNQVKIYPAVMKRAKEIRSNLEADQFPTFFKCVTSWIFDAFPRICVPYFLGDLLRCDRQITLVNEDRQEFKVKYVFKSNRLSAGCKHFCTKNSLCVGDVLVFQVIDLHFKVYIVRTNDFAVADRAKNSCKTPLEHIPDEDIIEVMSDSDLDDVSITRVIQKTGSDSFKTYTTEDNVEHMLSDSNHVDAAHTTKDVMSSRSSLDFTKVKSIHDFKIVINGMNIDAVLSEKDRMKYYELCLSQKSYLHEDVIKNVKDPVWASSIISQIVDIANALRACELSTPESDYTNWNKVLLSFQMLGLNVRFLRDRLLDLGTLSVDAEEFNALIKQIEVSGKEIQNVEEEIATLELEVCKRKKKKEEIAAEMKEKKTTLEERERKFHEKLVAPW